MFFIISFFSISLLHVRWRLPYMIKDDSSEVDLVVNSLTNEVLILDQQKNYSFMLFI